MATLIEIDSMDAASRHGNLWNSPSNQLRRMIGRHTQIAEALGHKCGTARDATGKAWDWWMDGEAVVVVEAR